MVLYRTVRAMITENSTKKTQARAFSYFAFFGNIGIFVGPFIGESSLFHSPVPPPFILTFLILNRWRV